MTDPMALVTDSALGVTAWIFAARLWRVQRMWALAFLFTGIAAFCGGVFHGFGDEWRLLLIQIVAVWMLYRAGRMRVHA
jgi:hypothetical protein